MEFCIEFKSYLIIAFISTLPLAACTNIDCNGKAFHCVNTTHFKICVDLGSGVSTTVDEYLIQCPQDTVCKSYNLFECEYEQTTTLPPVTIQSEVTNEQFRTSGPFLSERSDLTTFFPLNPLQGAEFSQKYNNIEKTSVSSILTLYTNAVINTTAVANTSDFFSSSTTESSGQDLSLYETKLPSSVSGIEISFPNIIQSETENVGNHLNKEIPSIYSTLRDSMTKDYLINENFTPVNPSSSSARIQDSQNINRVSYISEITESNTLPSVLLNYTDPELIKDTSDILHKNSLLLPNISEINNLDTLKATLNNSEFTKNNIKLGISTADALPATTSLNKVFNLNSMFLTTTTEKYYTDGGFKTNGPNLDEKPGQHLTNINVPPKPLEKAINQFISTTNANTVVAKGTLKNTDHNLEENSELFSSTDGYSKMATSNILTTTMNRNKMTSEISIDVDNGIYSYRNDSFIDKQNSTLIDKEQTSAKEILSPQNASNFSTQLDNLNETKYMFSSESYLPDKKMVTSTEIITFTSDIINETQSSVLNDLVPTEDSKSASISSMFLNITTAVIEPISIHHNDLPLTDVDEKTTITRSYSSSSLIFNKTSFDEAPTESTAIMGERSINLTSVSTAPGVSKQTEPTTPEIKEKFESSTEKNIKVTTDLTTFNETVDERSTSTEVPILHTTVVESNRNYTTDINISETSTIKESIKKSMNISFPLISTEVTNSLTYTTVANELDMDLPSSARIEDIPLPKYKIIPPERARDGGILQEDESVTVEKGEKNESIKSMLVNIKSATVLPDSNNFTTEIENNYISPGVFDPSIPDKLSTVSISNKVTTMKSLVDFMLETSKLEPEIIELAATTSIDVKQQKTESNIVFPSVTKIKEYISSTPQYDFYYSKEPVFDSIMSNSENYTNNHSYPTTLEKPTILTNLTRGSGVSAELNGTRLHNETTRTDHQYDSLNATYLAMKINTTDNKTAFNMSDVSYARQGMFTEFTTMTPIKSSHYLETDITENGVNKIITDFPELNVQTSTTSPGGSSSNTKFGTITEYRISNSNVSTDATYFKIDSSVTTERATYIDSYITPTGDEILTETAMSTNPYIDKIVTGAIYSKPTTQTGLLIKIENSNNSQSFVNHTIDKDNNNTTEMHTQETYNLLENLFPAEVTIRKDRLAKSVLKPQFLNDNNLTHLNIRKNITIAITADNVTKSFQGTEYTGISTSNGNLQIHTDDIINIRYNNKTDNLTLSPISTTSVKEQYLLYTLFKPPTTESNHRRPEFANKNKSSPPLADYAIHEKYNIRINKSLLNDIKANQSTGVPESNSSENVLKQISILPLEEINKTTYIVSNNNSANQFILKHMWRQGIYLGNVNETSNPNTNGSQLLHFWASKTNLNKNITKVLSPLLLELSRKSFLGNETNKLPFRSVNSTFNSKTDSLISDLIKPRLEVDLSGKSIKMEKIGKGPSLTHNHNTEGVFDTNKIYYSISSRTTKNKVTEGIKENKTNVIPTSTSKAIHVNVRFNDTKTKQEFKCVKRGKYSDHGNCNKFYLCFGRVKPVIGDCPPNTVFSEFLKQCTKNVAHCIRNDQFKCTAPGRYNNILSNNSYFICAKKNTSFIRFTLQCQKGYYLNKRNVKCTKELFNISTSTENSSKNTKEISAEKSKERRSSDIKERYFECDREGKFEDPVNCRRYYVCKKGNKSTFRRKIKKCDSDEVFHKKEKKCVDEESYECNI